VTTEAEANHPDLQAARRAHDRVGFYLPALERLAGAVLLTGEEG
jgi:hypothetical protein